MLNFPGKNMTKNNDKITTLNDDEITVIEEWALRVVERMTPIFRQMAKEMEEAIIEECKKL